MSSELLELVSSGKKRRIAKGQVIQSTDDAGNFNLVVSGYVKRYLISNEGNLRIQVVYGPGDIFPLTLAYVLLFNQKINAGPEVYYYEALTNVELVTLESEKFTKSIKDNPLIYRGLFIEAGKRLRSTLNGLENVTLKTSYNRVAHQLVYFATEYGAKMKNGNIKIDVPLTQQDIADILSTSRETVSICVVKLREKGLVNTGSAFVIPNLDKLLKEAYS